MGAQFFAMLIFVIIGLQSFVAADPPPYTFSLDQSIPCPRDLDDTWYSQRKADPAPILPNASTALAGVLSSIPEMLDGNMKTLNAPSAMFIAYQNGKKLFESYRGTARLHKAVPVTASSGFRIGPLLPGDLDAVMLVQEQCYAPELLEGPEVFRAILAHQPDLCRVVLADSEKRRVVGYMVAHRVRDTAAPPSLGEAPGPGSFPAEGPVFIHDVCLLEEARGRGLVTRLLGEIQEGAVHGMCLVAVQGTEAMWRRHGFAPNCPDGAAAVKGGSSPRVSTTADGAAAGEGVQRHENLLATAASVSDVAGSAQGCGHEPPSRPVLQGYGPQSTYMTRKLSSVSVPR